MKDEAFRVVYQTYSKLIYQSIWARTQNRELADDICQQTFLKYFQYMDTVTKGFEKGWLLAVSRNLLIDYYRKKKSLPAEDILISDLCEETVYNVDLTQELIRKNFLSQILYELEKKNKDWYDVLFEVCILNIPPQEVAEKHQISMDLLRTRLYRGRQYLKTLFGEEYDKLEK